MSLKPNQIKCRLCHDFSGTPEEVVAHAKSAHQCKGAKDYCVNYWKKHDLLTGQLLEFKSLEQYFLNDFASKTNLNKFLRESDKKTSYDYCLNQFNKFFAYKGLAVAPAHLELRTLSYLPNCKDLEKLFPNHGYETICREAKVSQRLSTDVKIYEKHLSGFNKNHLISQIQIDTREQSPLKFNKKMVIETKKLEYGDYGRPDLSPWAIERKSMSDFISTMSSGFDRFCREIERCQKDNGYLVVLVENEINKSLNFNYSMGRRLFGKCSPDFVFHKAREISRLFPNHVQFLFCDGRKEASLLTSFLISTKMDFAPKFDLQFFYDRKKDMSAANSF